MKAPVKKKKMAVGGDTMSTPQQAILGKALSRKGLNKMSAPQQAIFNGMLARKQQAANKTPSPTAAMAAPTKAMAKGGAVKKGKK